MTLEKTTTGLAPAQINVFWKEVEDTLRSRHQLPSEQAIRAIMKYRDEVDGVGMLYHQSPTDLAQGISDAGYADTN
jgi:hypothetical protein